MFATISKMRVSQDTLRMTCEFQRHWERLRQLLELFLRVPVLEFGPHTDMEGIQACLT